MKNVLTASHKMSDNSNHSLLSHVDNNPCQTSFSKGRTLGADEKVIHI